MDEDVVIRVENLWKRYGTTVGAELKRLLSFRSNSQGAPVDDGGLWALRDINFEVRRGEMLGVIGRNGSGKSTLLKVLAGVTPSTYGDIEVRGRIFPMIELNAGMHFDLTGRQNVHLLGAVMGFSSQEMQDRMPEIEEFCELDEWFDRPVWMYSSGMLARLGFSVAVNVNTEILLVDEVLSVGDLSFQRKCYRRMEQLRGGGVTTVFVSHSTRQVERLCTEVILLNRGQVIRRGDPTEVCQLYMQTVTEESLKKAGLALDENITEATWEGSGEVIIAEVETLDGAGKPCEAFLTGAPLRIRIEFVANRVIKDPIIGIGIYTVDMLLLAAFSDERASIGMTMDGKGHFECEIPNPPMLPGVYSIGVTVKGRDSSLIYKGLHLARFSMQYSARAKQSRGFIHLEPRWDFAPEKALQLDSSKEGI